MRPATEAGRPPGPRGAATLRVLLRGARDPVGALSELSRTHGDVVLLRAGPARIYLLGRPDLAAAVLEAGPDRVIKGAGWLSAGRLLGSGQLNVEGPGHRRQRERMGPLVRREPIDKRVRPRAFCRVTALE